MQIFWLLHKVNNSNALILRLSNQAHAWTIPARAAGCLKLKANIGRIEKSPSIADSNQPDKGAVMARQIYGNLPVKNLERTKAFFTASGFSFEPKFSDENAVCMVIGENIFVMRPRA